MTPEARRRIARTQPRFAWDAREDSPALPALRTLLEAVPDQALRAALRAARGPGRAAYPRAVLGGTLLLSSARHHGAVEACLEELRRNPALRLLLGLEREDAVPGPDNLSRCLATLGAGPHLTHRRQSFDVPGTRLGQVVGDLGRDTASDSPGRAGRAAVRAALRAAGPAAAGRPWS